MFISKPTNIRKLKMLTATQKKTAEAIIHIFKTGSILGDYGHVPLIKENV